MISSASVSSAPVAEAILTAANSAANLVKSLKALSSVCAAWGNSSPTDFVIIELSALGVRPSARKKHIPQFRYPVIQQRAAPGFLQRVGNALIPGAAFAQRGDHIADFHRPPGQLPYPGAPRFRRAPRARRTAAVNASSSACPRLSLAGMECVHGPDFPLQADRLFDDLADAAFACGGDNLPERSTERAARVGDGPSEHCIQCLIQQRAVLLLFQHGEVGGHACLERKAVKQPLAKGVDGMDLQAALGVEGPPRKAGAPVSCQPASRGCLANPSARRPAPPRP